MTSAGRVNPPSLGQPSGFAHGIVAPAGARLLFVAGQIGTAGGAGQTGDFLAQFDLALANVLTVVHEAGGTPAQVARMTIYVVSLDAYRSHRASLGTVWQARMQRHYPAMTVVEVRQLVDPAALVEIEATAVLS